MPTVQLVSDCHWEHHRDGGREWIDSLDPEGVDVLVLAGDISTVSYLGAGLDRLCRRYSGASVLYVNGNHTYYGNLSRAQVEDEVLAVANGNTNFTWLNNDVVTIKGQRFIGTTLWFPKSRKAQELASSWYDFRSIRDLASWVYRENEIAQTFLRTEMLPGDVVVTHYLPCWQAVHPQYASSESNCYFVCDMEDLILERKPKAWLYGHTHEKTSIVVGETRLECNPLGYVGYEHAANARFDPQHRIEL